MTLAMNECIALLDVGMKREYEGNEWGDAKRQRGTGPYVDIRVLLPSKVRMACMFSGHVVLCMYIYIYIRKSDDIG